MKKIQRNWVYLITVLGVVMALSNSCKKEGENNNNNNNPTVKDIDGNVYHTVTIGTQIWMVENLKVTKFNDSIVIPLISDGSAWTNMTSSGYCWYNNDESGNKNIYGALYNYHVIATGKLCPPGWHVPTDAEWSTLTEFLGGYSLAGGMLKETGTSHWQSPNKASNESGFTALPGGSRSCDGTFSEIGKVGYWWTSTYASPSGMISVWGRGISNGARSIGSITPGETFGLSVRCIKDKDVP